MSASPALPAEPGSPRAQVLAVLERRRPERIVYAPNYWQWFAHHRHHGTLPAELAGCRTQLDLINHLGLDVCSRNVYCDQRRCWFGGLADVVYDGIDVVETEARRDADLIYQRRYITPAGTLEERQRYVFAESTLVQEKFAVDNFARQLDAFEQLVAARRWQFHPQRYAEIEATVGQRGLVMAGELHSPLKMLHFLLGAAETTYLLVDQPERAAAILARHEAAQLDLVRQMAAAGVKVMISMDNLDAVFHTPAYVEQYSASYYERAARICHQHGSLLFIHACGRQKANLRRIASYGVDGLEGVAFPPLGDVELQDAFELAGERLIITGGISALETDNLKDAAAVDAYVADLFRRIRPYAHRFMLSASCATAYNAPWETLKHFRDAWQRHAALA